MAALTDEQMQGLQGVVIDWSKLDAGQTKVVDPDDNISYEIINTENGVTQAIAVAPVVNGKTDYSQTAIVVAGTISLGDRLDIDAWASFYRALEASDGMAAQYQDISDFYDATEKKIAKHQGTITNMSGFSQSGPPIAKKAAVEALEDKSGKKIIKITKFMLYYKQIIKNVRL